MMPVSNMLGERFGRLLVVKEHPKRQRAGHVCWVCQCDCGTRYIVQGRSLRTGYTKSCGCFAREQSSKRETTHGHTKNARPSRTYSSWAAMMSRCYNKRSKDYKRYGAKGISVCRHWHKFENFLNDMGIRPEGKSIDRLDPAGNYNPRNCRWATAKEQVQNRRPSNYKVSEAHKRKLARLKRKFWIVWRAARNVNRPDLPITHWSKDNPRPAPI